MSIKTYTNVREGRWQRSSLRYGDPASGQWVPAGHGQFEFLVNGRVLAVLRSQQRHQSVWFASVTGFEWHVADPSVAIPKYQLYRRFSSKRAGTRAINNILLGRPAKPA